MLVPVLAFPGTFPCWHPCTGPTWPPASRFVVLANPCTFCDTFACCCCGCCWGMLLTSGVCPSIPDPLPCWLGVLGTGGNPSPRLQPPFPVPLLPSPLSAIPGLGQPCTPWLTLPGSIPTYAQQAGSSATMQKVPQPSKPTWVSVQDVVLNSLRPSTQPSQTLPELSHFYQTHKHRKMSAHVAMVLVGVSRLDTKRCGVASQHLSANSHKSDQKHMSSQKAFTSRHGLFV